jgi:hypothetical protein
MKKVLIAGLFAVAGIANAGEAEIRMSQKMIDINNGSLLCGKIVKAEKIQDTSKFLDVLAICSNGEVYRMGVMYGKARDVKVAIPCSKPFSGWGKEAAQEMNITSANCKNPKG